MYIGMYSWLVELEEGNEVVGVVSKVCRKNFGTNASNIQSKIKVGNGSLSLSLNLGI